MILFCGQSSNVHGKSTRTIGEKVDLLATGGGSSDRSNPPFATGLHVIDVNIKQNKAHNSPCRALLNAILHSLLNAILHSGKVAKRAIPTYTNNTVSKQQA